MRRLATAEAAPKAADHPSTPLEPRARGAQPPTLVLATRKGGTGKTTLAVHLALAAHIRGLKAVLADADPQRSATEALRGRTGDAPRLLDATRLDPTALRARALGLGADLLVLDTPGGPGPTLAEALPLADLALLVARPTFLDIAAAVRTQAEARSLGVPTVIVLNQAPPMRSGAEAASVETVLEALRANRLAVAPAIVRARAAFQTCMATGRSVEELAASPAAEDMAMLWRTVEGLLAESLARDETVRLPAWLAAVQDRAMRTREARALPARSDSPEHRV